jgi:hypothetical protein
MRSPDHFDAADQSDTTTQCRHCRFYFEAQGDETMCEDCGPACQCCEDHPANDGRIVCDGCEDDDAAARVMRDALLFAR